MRGAAVLTRARRWGLASAVLAALLIGLGVPARGDEPAVRRIFGGDRYATAAAISAEAFPDGAATVVLARGDDFADALSAAGLAGAVEGPILLTERTHLPEAAAAELLRLQATTAVVVGGPAAVGSGVLQHLRDLGLETERVWGDDRYATAAAVARVMEPRLGTLNGSHAVLLATGTGYADAVAAGPLAYAARLPILLTPPGGLAPDAAAAIADMGIPWVIILGGEQAVTAAVERALPDVFVQRIAGPDRTATAAAVARVARTVAGFGDDDVMVARGDHYADALAAAPLGGSRLTPVLLTREHDRVGMPTRRALRVLSGHTADATILGGSDALFEGVALAIEGILAGEPEAVLTYNTATDTVVAGHDGEELLTVDTGQSVALAGGTLAHERHWQEPDPEPDDPTEGRHVDLQLRDALTGRLRAEIPDGWAPLLADDGETVVFLPDPPGRRDHAGTSLFIRDASGSVRRLVQFAGEPGAPGIPTGHDEPSVFVGLAMDVGGSRVAVAFGAPPSEPGATTALYDVWVIDTATGAVSRITDDHRSWQPALSPDGSQLAFMRDHTVCGDESYFAGHLEVVDLPGGEPRRLVSTTCDGFFYLPRWLDEDTIVAHRISVSQAGTHRDLVTIDATTGDQTVLVDDLPAPGSVNLSVSSTLGLVTYQDEQQQANDLWGFWVLDPARNVRLPFPGQAAELNADMHH